MMASRGTIGVDSDMFSNSEGELSEDFVDKCAMPIHNRFEQRQDGGDNTKFVSSASKRKKRSSGSIDSFAGMGTDDKLICIFEQLNKNYERIRYLEAQQTSYRDETRLVSECVSGLTDRMERIEELYKAQQWHAKVLSHKSIDIDARDMRNNIVIYGLTEKIRYNSNSLVFNFLENELDIDICEMKIERAHRMGQITDERYRNRSDPKRPMVVRFRDYVDTETILSKAYKLKGTNFGVDRQYPKEISVARAKLYSSQEAKQARAKRQKVQ